MKRAFLITLAAAGLVVATAGVVSAHSFGVQPGCGGLSWSATAYNGQQTNRITVTIDGTVVYSDLDFGTTDVGSRAWTPSADHSWSVVVDAPGTEFDHTPQGVQTACSPPTTATSTTTTTSSTTTTVGPLPTTTVAPSTSTSTTVPPSTPTTSDTSTTPPTSPSDPSSSPPSSSASPVTTSPTASLPTTATAATAPAERLDPPSNLPATGATGSNVLIAVTVVLLVAGSAVLWLTRRRA